MNDRERLIELIQQTIIPYWAEQIADHLLANGVTFAADTNVGGKWIPVSERLPETRKNVLICSADGGVAEGDYHRTLQKWTQYRWRADDLHVTHWMPLPEPPKGD